MVRDFIYKASGIGLVEVDESGGYLTITLPCFQLTPEEALEIHGRQAVVSVEVRDEN